MPLPFRAISSIAAVIISAAHPGASASYAKASTAATGSRALTPSKGFGGPLACAPTLRSSAVAIARARFSQADAVAALTWADVELRRIGFSAQRPANAAAGYIAALAQSGHLVAAKMAKDELAASSKAFGASEWSRSFEAFLTVQTQPVNHASYPTSVRAEGERAEQETGHAHGYGVDLEDTSAALREIIARAGLVQRALGRDYATPSVRYYQLAHGFRDDIALEAAAAQVCELSLAPDTIRKLDISARMMAMPTRAEAGAAR